MDKKEIICYLLAILVGVGVFLLGLFNPGKWPREMAVFVIIIGALSVVISIFQFWDNWDKERKED